MLNSNLIFYSSVFVSHFSHMNNRVHKPKRANLIRYFIRPKRANLIRYFIRLSVLI